MNGTVAPPSARRNTASADVMGRVGGWVANQRANVISDGMGRPYCHAAISSRRGFEYRPRFAQDDGMIQEVVERKPVRTISLAELRDKLARRGPLKLVMTLNAWASRAKHIPTSLHFNNSDEMQAALKKDDEIVVYS